MSNSLDRLKALSTRLEKKLEKRIIVSDNNSKVVEKDIITKSKPKSEPKDNITIVEEKKVLDVISEESIALDDDNVKMNNIIRVKELYEKLGIFEKSPLFNNVFMYKAMNLSGIGLKEDDFGEVREGKYIQIIAITYEPDKNGKKKAKNISLGYFGKAETLEASLKNEIIEFVLRWRYEKAFQNVEHYKELIDRVN